MAEISASFTRGRFQVTQYKLDTPLGGTACSQTMDTKTAPVYNIVSEVVIKTHYTIKDPDHVICVIGSTDRLGNWDPTKAIIMTQATKRGFWRVRVHLPHNGVVQWKLVVLDKRSFRVVRWEERANRILKLAGPVEIIAPWNNAELIRIGYTGNCQYRIGGNRNKYDCLQRTTKNVLGEKEPIIEDESEYAEHSDEDDANNGNEFRIVSIKSMTANDVIENVPKQPGPRCYGDDGTYSKCDPSSSQAAPVDSFKLNSNSEFISVVNGNVENALYTSTSTEELENECSNIEIMIGSNESIPIKSEEMSAPTSDLIVRKRSDFNVSNREIDLLGIGADESNWERHDISLVSTPCLEFAMATEVNNSSNQHFGTDIDAALENETQVVAVSNIKTVKENGRENMSDKLNGTIVGSATEYRAHDVAAVPNGNIAKENRPENMSAKLSETDVDRAIEYRAHAAAVSNIKIEKEYKPGNASIELYDTDVDDAMMYRLQIGTELEMDKLSMTNEQDGSTANGSESTVHRDTSSSCKRRFVFGASLAAMTAVAGYLYYKMKN